MKGMIRKGFTMKLHEGQAAEYARRLKRALNRLRSAPSLQRTLRLIVKNGSNRKESIWELMSRGRQPGGRRSPSTKLTAKNC